MGSPREFRSLLSLPLPQLIGGTPGGIRTHDPGTRSTGHRSAHNQTSLAEKDDMEPPFRELVELFLRTAELLEG